MKTAELLTEWLTSYERERVKPRTYARYEGLINLHNIYLGIVTFFRIIFFKLKTSLCLVLLV